MADAKTKPTAVSIDGYLQARTSPEQLADCQALMALLQRVTNEPPRIWGPSIVGYGMYSYRYDSGRTGESFITGFAVRGKDLVVYLVADSPAQPELLAQLGKFRMGKSCLYLRRLADVDTQVLEALVSASVAEVKRRHGTAGGA